MRASSELHAQHTILMSSSLCNRSNVVVVNIQYRLNVFGFLALPELQAESGLPNTTGNYAMQVRHHPHQGVLGMRCFVQDQRFALQWAQNNVRNFGGDPSRVLLFGQSAGGGSVCYHLVSSTSRTWHAAVVTASLGFPCLARAVPRRHRRVAHLQ